MVLRVCRQILRDPHDAEDASQATFLVLSRKARSIRRADSVASWLYGVACRVSARAKSDAARRRGHERRSAKGSVRPVDDQGPHESWAELHEELGRLPEKFRLPIVLFHFEGLSYEQAAQRIRCPVRTVQSRLARGRERLRARLARRGVSPTATLIAAFLAPDTAAAAVMDTWKRSTVKAAVCYAAGKTSASVPPTVAALARGAMKAMMLDKLKSAAAAALLLGVIAGGLGAWARSESPAPNDPERRYRLTMVNGTKIEVVGVSAHPSAPGRWWRPDGSPLDEELADRSSEDVDAPDSRGRAILIRVADLPEGATFKWSPTHDGRSWGIEPKKDGRRLRGMEMYVSSYQRDRATCAVKVRVAAGPWETEYSHDGKGGFSAFKGRLKFHFGKAREYRGGTAISVAQNIIDRDSRVVAVDLDGKVHPAVWTSGAGGDVLTRIIQTGSNKEASGSV